MCKFNVNIKNDYSACKQSGFQNPLFKSYNLVAPCNCSGNNIYCTSINNVTQTNFEAMFERLGEQLDSSGKKMNMLLVHSTGVEQLTNDMFKGISFERMEFYHNTKLTKVESAAFHGISADIKTIIFQGNEHLYQGATRDDGMLYALGWLTGAESIEILQGCNITAIPAYSFPPVNGFQTKLVNLTIDDNHKNLKKIESRALWYLSFLKRFKLERSGVNEIGENAFEMEQPGVDDWFTIDLGHHYDRDGSIFRANSLSKIKRPVELILPGAFTPKGPTPNFKYLYENAFLPFFSENPKNFISGVVAVNCNDCRNVWLKSYPNFISRIAGLRCYSQNSNGNYNFNDPSNFADC